MSHITLTPAERSLCECIEAGIAYSVPSQAKLRGSVIRNIVLGIPVKWSRSKRAEIRAVAMPAGIVIENAQIDGRMDMAGAGQDGSICSRLIFRNCVIEGGLCMDHAHVGQVLIEGCKFACDDTEERTDSEGAVTDSYDCYSIDFRGAHVEGDFYILDSLPAKTDGYFYVSLLGAKIHGTVRVAASVLKAPYREGPQPIGYANHTALNAKLCEIDGDLQFDPRTNLIGSASLRSAKIHGDVWILGADIDASKLGVGKKGLNFQGASVVGNFIMRSGDLVYKNDTSPLFPNIKPDLYLYGASIGGILEITDLAVEGNLCLMNAEAGSIKIARSKRALNKFKGSVHNSGLVVRGNVEFDVTVESASSGQQPYINFTGSRIDGTLDISGLKVVSGGKPAKGYLSLEDSVVGQSLAIRPALASQPKLVAVRSKVLQSLDGYKLVETLWSLENQKVEAGFLIKNQEIVFMNGLSEVFDGISKKNATPLNDLEAAEEFLRVFCKYLISGSEGQDSSFRLITSRSDAAGFMIDYPRIWYHWNLNKDSHESEDTEDTEDPVSDNPLQGFDRVLAFESLSDAPDDWFDLEGRQVDGEAAKFEFTSGLLYSGYLFKANFLLSQKPGTSIDVDMIGHAPSGLSLKGSIQNRSGAFYGQGRGNKFMTSDTLSGMEDADPLERMELETRLLPIFRTLFETSGVGTADLTGLKCSTLRDDGGSAWSKETKLLTNRFQFDKAVWAQNSSVTGSSWANSIRRGMMMFLPKWILIWLSKKGVKLKTPSKSDWQMRRDWIDLSYPQDASDANIPPSRSSMIQGPFNVELFERLMRMCQMEGRDTDATRFEIDKRDIVWRRQAVRSRRVFFWVSIMLALVTLPIMAWMGVDMARLGLLIGLSALLYVLIKARQPVGAILSRQRQRRKLEKALEGRNSALGSSIWKDRSVNDSIQNRKLFRQYGLSLMKGPGPGWMLLAFLVCILVMNAVTSPTWSNNLANLSIIIAIVGIVTYLSDITNFVMRACYGYLRRPVRAMLTVLAAFLLGWWGVETANNDRMMVVSIAPVAPLVAELPDGVRPGGQFVSIDGEDFGRNIHCGDTIIAPLYAMDILIPLIDLKQESRCDVGVAALPYAEINPRSTESAQTKTQSLQWAAAKAAYGVLGWILASLLVLTFTFSFGARQQHFT